MKYQGFTLIEIIIVLVIIAIMSSLVMLNIGASTYTRFMTDADKIASTLEIIGDQAVYTNSVVVCGVNPNGLDCQSYKDGEWSDLPLSKLVSWAWPSSITVIKVNVNGNQLKDGGKIRFFPTGDLPPMSFEITDGSHKTWIDGNLSGDFKVNN